MNEVERLLGIVDRMSKDGYVTTNDEDVNIVTALKNYIKILRAVPPGPDPLITEMSRVLSKMIAHIHQVPTVLNFDYSLVVSGTTVAEARQLLGELEERDHKGRLAKLIALFRDVADGDDPYVTYPADRALILKALEYFRDETT